MYLSNIGKMRAHGGEDTRRSRDCGILKPRVGGSCAKVAFPIPRGTFARNTTQTYGAR